jgi:hypothetical protein
MKQKTHSSPKCWWTNSGANKPLQSVLSGNRNSFNCSRDWTETSQRMQNARKTRNKPKLIRVTSNASVTHSSFSSSACVGCRFANMFFIYVQLEYYYFEILPPKTQCCSTKFKMPLSTVISHTCQIVFNMNAVRYFCIKLHHNLPEIYSSKCEPTIITTISL